MNLLQIQYVIAIVESESMTEAAEKMYVSQSALSLSYKKLENELGVDLFYKHERRLKLTESGEVFYKKAKPVIEALNDLQNGMKEIAAEKEQRILVCTEAVDFTNEAVKIYRRICPDLFFQQVRGSTEEINVMLNSGAADFAVTLSPDFGAGTASVLLLDEPMLALVSQNEKYAHDKRVSIPELAREPLIILREGLAVNRLFRSYYEAANVPCDHVVEVNDPETIMMQVSDGIGISFIPESTANLNAKMCSPATSGTITLPVDGYCKRSVYLVSAKNRPIKKSVQKFIDFLISFGTYSGENKCFPRYEDIITRI